MRSRRTVIRCRGRPGKGEEGRRSRRPSEGSGKIRRRAECRRSSHFGKSRLDVVGGGELGARERGGDEGVMREEIDLARQTRRRLEERFDGGRLEERELGAGEAEPMAEIAGDLVAGE